MSRYANALMLREDVRSHEEAFKELMPKGYRLDRFMSTLDVWVQRNPELLRCDPISVVAECQKAVHDGMVFDGRRAILVPFFDRKSKAYMAQYMPMYQGILERLHDLGDVKGIECNAVYQADHFEVFSRDNTLIVDWSPNTEGGDRGFVRAVYVHFKGFNNQIIHTEVMLRDDIEKARLKSNNPNGEAWRDWYSEMARKTVIHRGSKYVPLSDEGRRIVTREESFTLIEGQAIASTRAAGDNPLADHSLDDYDDDGNLLRQPEPEPEILPDPIRAQPSRVVEAEVIAMPQRSVGDAAPFDDELDDDGPMFAIDETPESPLIVFERRLSNAQSLSEARRVMVAMKDDIAGGSREDLLYANRLWAQAVERFKAPSEPQGRPAKPEPKAATKRSQRRRA